MEVEHAWPWKLNSSSGALAFHWTMIVGLKSRWWVPFLPQSCKWKTTLISRKLIFEGPIFHFHVCGRKSRQILEKQPGFMTEKKIIMMLIPSKLRGSFECGRLPTFGYKKGNLFIASPYQWLFSKAGHCFLQGCFPETHPKVELQ